MQDKNTLGRKILYINHFFVTMEKYVTIVEATVLPKVVMIKALFIMLPLAAHILKIYVFIYFY